MNGTDVETSTDQTEMECGDNNHTVEHPADRIMAWFAVQVLQPWFQCLALLLFAGLTAGSIYCATQLEQQFDFTDMVPQDSYLKSYYESMNSYTERAGVYTNAYFRDVDQSDPDVQRQMESYLNDLVKDADVDPPIYFWVWDFRKYTATRAQEDDTFANKTFAQQMDDFLAEPMYHALYDEDIGREEHGPLTGQVWESRCKLHVNVDRRSSKATVDMLANLREISGSQPINQGVDDWKFFTYDDVYHLYE